MKKILKGAVCDSNGYLITDKEYELIRTILEHFKSFEWDMVTAV